MILNIFKIVLCGFLIFLSCFFGDVRGKTITELEEINEVEFGSPELNSKISQDTADEGSVNVTSADDCDGMPCENGGTCYIKDGKAVCECPVGYSGYACEKNDCDGMPCENGGTCYIKDGKAVCECPVGYSGYACEKNDCDGMNCENGGICKIIDGKVGCECPDGYTGYACEKQEDLCSEVCGVNPGVVCEGDKTQRDAITCSCKDEDRVFDGEQKQCRVIKEFLCSVICGENAGVVCEYYEKELDPITCSCNDEDKIFDEEEKECKDRKDTKTCVFNHWQVSWETAAKRCAEEDASLLCYESREEMDNILESFNLQRIGIDTSKFAIWLGNRNYTSEKNETEKCLSLHIEKSNDTKWHYFQTNCDEVNPFVCCVHGTNECDEINCQNGGICKIIDGEAECECPDGYIGDVCENLALDPCRNHSCQNGGRCISYGENFKCLCIAPFTGQFCEIGPCSNETCLNGGQCVVTWWGFKCNCKEPYSGKFCETNLCAQYNCENNGTCRVIGEKPECFCKEPYGGKFCEIRMGDCVTNFCNNGGICRTINGEPKCFCLDPYGGKFCSTRTDSRYNSTILPVVYLLLSLVWVSVAVLITCLLCRRLCLVKKY